MTRIAFCNTILFGLTVCLAGGSGRAQDLRVVDAPPSQVRLAAPQQVAEPIPAYAPSSSGYALAAPPPSSSAPGAPSSVLPSAPAGPSFGVPSSPGVPSTVAPNAPGYPTFNNPNIPNSSGQPGSTNAEAEPSLGLTYDARVNNWIDPNQQSINESNPGASLDTYAIPPGSTNPPPGPPTSGWLKGGWLHGGLLRNFVYGNDGVRAAAIPGANELWAGFEDWAPPVADRTPRFGIYLWESYEGWRSIADGNTKPNLNNGPNQGINLAAPIPFLDTYGIGAQFGMSYAAFNPTADMQQQTFVTVGLFRRADADRPVSFGVVYDLQINDGFGAYQQSFTLGQIRAQLAYAFTARNEIGIWGTMRNGQEIKYDPLGNQLQYRAISQGSLFWHHKFGPGRADLWLATGLPSAYRLGGTTVAPGAGDRGSFEDNIFSFRLEAPVTDRWKFFTSFQGWRPTNAASNHSLFDIMSGISFYPAGNARSRTVAGQTWMPYLPVANNASFMVDTNLVP